MNTILDLIYEERYMDALELIRKEKDAKGNNDTLAILEASAWQRQNEREKMWKAISEGLQYNSCNYELYFMLGDYYVSTNKKQAWLCYENAKFYCKDKEDYKTIQQRMESLEEEITHPPKAAIILVSYNNIEMTRNCIASIRENCISESYELVVVDNASKDGSVEWLKSQQKIKLICNNENVGFPKACNQGIEVAGAESDIFFLNNDTLLMPNSLFWLRMGLYEQEDVGACGSVSNAVGNHQKIKEIYDTVGGYIEYALKHNVPERYPYEERMYLIGFAMLIKRTVVEQVGILDERFSPGNFEDTDYGIRIIKEGYRNRVCRNSFIFHWGSQSFGKKLENYKKLLERNKKMFEEKWQRNYEEFTGIHTDIIEKMELDKITDTKTILDLDCGYGMTLAKIQSDYQNVKCYGISKEEETAQIASRYGCVLQGKLESINFHEFSVKFDYMIGVEALDKVTKPKEFLKEIQNFLNTDGSLMLTVENMEKWSEVSLKELLHECGYKIENIWYYGMPGKKNQIHQILLRVTKNDDKKQRS